VIHVHVVPPGRLGREGRVAEPGPVGRLAPELRAEAERRRRAGAHEWSFETSRPKTSIHSAWLRPTLEVDLVEAKVEELGSRPGARVGRDEHPPSKSSGRTSCHLGEIVRAQDVLRGTLPFAHSVMAFWSASSSVSAIVELRM
jgi:hypothetical protein